MARDLPGSARCVIVGGGVGGCSIAYHLAKLGWEDVVLVDRNQLTSGSTFHSAGLVGQLRGSVSLTRMMMDSVELYRTLDCGWVECGGLRLASSEARWEETRRQAGWAKTFGLPLELLSAEEAQERFPLMTTDGVLGASWLPTDGYLDPSLLTYALAEGAREGGCDIHTNTRVTGIDVRDGRVRGVRTERGDIEADVVVNAGGMYAAEIGRLAGVRVPLVPMAHEYLVTQPFRDRNPDEPLPTMRDPDLLVYFREDAGGLVMGGYERHSEPWALDEGGVDAIPADFNGRLLEEDWERFEEITVNARKRVPVIDEVTITKLINGPEAFTPDGEFLLGESHVRGFFVAAGFCAHGLAGAGGMGKLMAEWIAEGEPSLDVWAMDTRRFGEHYRSPAYTLKRTREVYETYYDIKYPGHEREAGRPLRVSPGLRLARRPRRRVRGEVGLGARELVRGERGGRRRVAAPARLGGAALVARDRRRARRHPRGRRALRRDLVREARDQRAGRRRAARVAVRQPRRPRPGQGHLHADAQPPRRHRVRLHRHPARGRPLLDRHRHRVRHPRPRLDQLARGRRRAGRGRHLALGLHRAVGPARPRHPRPLHARPARLQVHERAGDHGRRRARARAAGHLRRRARVGALLPDGVRQRAVADAVGGGRAARARGRRLPRDRLAAAREGLPRVGRRHHARRHARTRAALGFAVKLDKDFIGRDALDGAEPARRLCCVVLADPRSVALGNEPVRAGGEICGRVTSGGFGYTLGASIAYAYLPAEHAEPGTEVAVEVFGEWIDGEVRAEPLFDPDGARVRG